ncbi:MAG: nucleotidyltransferase domain-containing protein [Melioribacteraceae bacterium]|nr:nucleotidyltransferase domain-containing protein [Melioribacteraceae bacterium]
MVDNRIVKKTNDRFYKYLSDNSIKERFKLIFAGIVGSTLYNTDTEDSDIDIKGVFIPPKEYFLGNLHKIDQFESKKKEEDDIVFYNIRKFFHIVCDCNPTFIELLFIPEEYIIKDTLIWEKIIDNRNLFLSKRARHSFMGYAVSQLKRIKMNREWLINAPKKKPERKDFGLPEHRRTLTSDQIGAFNTFIVRFLEEAREFHTLKDQLEEMNETFSFRNAIQRTEINFEELEQFLPEVNEQIIEALKREKSYNKAMAHWNSYISWKETRNPRKKELEMKYGYDVKHALHLVRLIYEGKELLETGHITLPRPESDLLKDILNGKWSFDYLLEFVEDFDKTFEELYYSSPLRKEPKRVKIDELLIDINFGKLLREG